MKTMMEKLRDRAGESLVEVLVTLLICVMSLGLLTTAIFTSAAVTKNSDKRVNEYYAAQNDVAEKTGTAEKPAGSGTVTISGAGIGTETYEVEYFANTTYGNTPVISYKKKTVTP